jgi:hypothetical protein
MISTGTQTGHLLTSSSSIITGSVNIGNSTTQSSPMSVNGDLVVGGGVRVTNGSLTDLLGQITERLALVIPNPDLEEEWSQLADLGNQYRAMEQKCLAKSRTWKLLHAK